MAIHSEQSWAVAAAVVCLAGLAGCGDSVTPPADPTPDRVVQKAVAGGAQVESTPKQPATVPPAATVLPPPPPFDGWPKPAVALLFTGQQLGYIEPCGCTGLENQKGGLARRHTLIRQLQDEKGWPVVPLDVGSQIRRYGTQSVIKFKWTADALRTLGYRAAVLGADDLRLPAAELYVATNPDDKPSIFTAANVALLDREFQPQFQVIEAGGKKIGVAAVLGDAFERKLEGGDLVHEPAIEGLKKGCTELKQQNCDYYVLLAHAPEDESRKIAQEVPLFDLVVTSGGAGLPSSELEAIEGTKSKLLKVSHKAMHASVVGLFDERANPIRLQNVPLDSQLKDSPEMLKLLADYQQELKSLGLEGLGLKPQPLAGATFVGSQTCGECHTKAFAIWSKTPHARATDSLVTPPNSRGDIPRHFDPECLSCHVTGWEPQKFYPLESGYLGQEKTPQLQHNGCENCHGPGSAHVAAENDAADEAAKTKLRDAMKLPIAGGRAENKCRECHDEDNSPDFSHKGFAAYWKEVEHKGKD